MIICELYLLAGHPPSIGAASSVEFFMKSKAGYIVNTTTVDDTLKLKHVMSNKKIRDLPALDVPGPVVRRKKTREIIIGEYAIREWCAKEAQHGEG